jgi:hypothetical protein
MATRNSKTTKVTISFECPASVFQTLMRKVLFAAPDFESAQPKKSSQKKTSTKAAGEYLRSLCPGCQLCAILAEILEKGTFTV